MKVTVVGGGSTYTPELVDGIARTPAGKPDYRWAKEQTESRPADDVHANHVGAKS